MNTKTATSYAILMGVMCIALLISGYTWVIPIVVVIAAVGITMGIVAEMKTRTKPRRNGENGTNGKTSKRGGK